MLAIIDKQNTTKVAVFDRTLQHSIGDVWAYLTENMKLRQWFSELEIQSLENGGEILFDFGDGTYEKMEILEVKPKEVFAFSWPPENTVRFELKHKDGHSHLIFTQYLHEVNEHTAKDLAGWHVCLDVIEALLDEKEIENRTRDWEKIYPKYQELVEQELR